MNCSLGFLNVRLKNLPNPRQAFEIAVGSVPNIPPISHLHDSIPLFSNIDPGLPHQDCDVSPQWTFIFCGVLPQNCQE